MLPVAETALPMGIKPAGIGIEEPVLEKKANNCSKECVCMLEDEATYPDVAEAEGWTESCAI